jgi:hypothetical protein
VGLVCLKGTGQWSGDSACLWIPGLTSLGGVVQQNRDCAYVGPWLGRPWGHSPAEQRSCRAVQALGVCSNGMEIVCVCISGPAGLGGMAWQSRDLAGCANLGGVASKAENMQGWEA